MPAARSSGIRRGPRRFFSLALAILSAHALAAAESPVAAQAPNSPRKERSGGPTGGERRSVSAESPPSGLVVVIENKPQEPRLDLAALKNPFISGVAVQIRWRDLEPLEGRPDWSKLDQLFAAAESSNKWVQLLVFPGFFSPPWALEGARSLMFPIPYGPGKGTLEKLPLPWDRIYLGHWFDFLKRLRARYGNSPAFRVVAAAGPTSVSAEFTLPHAPEDVQKWRSAGYSPSMYEEAWRRVFEEYAADFPAQYVSLSLGFGLNIDERGKRDARAARPTREAVVEEAIRILGRRFALQNSNLDGHPEPARGPHGVPFVIGYNGRIVTGFQLRTSCLRNSGDMGADGDPALALKKALDRGLQRNGAGHRVNYLEIYEPDVRADELQPVLRDAASLLQR